MIELRTFGTLSVRGPDGVELDALIAQPKRLALLVYLCVATPRGFHRRDTLLGIFWPESDVAHARAALRKALYVLRRAVGDQAIVSRGEDEVRANPGAIWCDAAAFQDHVEAGRVEEGISLYHGDLLPGFFLNDVPEFERWLERERSRLRDLASRTARQLVDRLESEGRLGEAVAAARAAASLDETDERALRRLLELLNRVGDRTGAVSAYDDFVERVAASAGVEPSAETQQLVSRIRVRTKNRTVMSADSLLSAVASAHPAADEATVPPPTVSARSSLRARPTLIGLGMVACLAAVVASSATFMRRPSSPLPTIAVLPFDNVSRDSADRYFAETMHTELVSRLGMIPSIRVRPRDAVLRYRGDSAGTRRIAEELGVDLMLQGGVGRDSSRVYTSVRLIDARGSTLWRQEYSKDRSVGSLFETQSDIARRLADALEVKIGATVRGRIGNRPTESNAAYEAYLEASRRDVASSREENAAAEALLKHAVALDPGFPAALASLAQVYQARAYSLGGSRAWADSGLALAREAVKADSTLLSGYQALGFGHLELGHLDRSRSAYQTVVDLRPSDGQALLVLGWIEFLEGKLADAVSIWAQTLVADPMNPTAFGDMGLVALLFGDFTQAERWHYAVTKLGTRGGVGGFGPARSLLVQGKAADAAAMLEQQLVSMPRFVGRGLAAAAAIETGNFIRARHHLEEMHRTAPDDWDFWGTTHRTSYAYVLEQLGERTAARAMLDTTLRHAMRLIAEGDQRPGVRREIAAIHAGLGHRDAALEWFERAIDMGWRHEVLKPSPYFESLRANPKFRQLLQRMNSDIARAADRVRRGNLGPSPPQ